MGLASSEYGKVTGCSTARCCIQLWWRARQCSGTGVSGSDTFVDKIVGDYRYGTGDGGWIASSDSPVFAKLAARDHPGSGS